MENKNISDLLKHILLDKFLVNFFPGLILFFGLINAIDIRVGEGLTAFLIVTCASWTLGVLLEMIVFRKSFYERWQGVSSHTSIESLNLLFGKTGISIFFACLSLIDIERLLENFDHNPARKAVLIKALLFCVAGGLLYWRYRKQRKNKN